MKGRARLRHRDRCPAAGKEAANAFAALRRRARADGDCDSVRDAAAQPTPFCFLDEIEAALDDGNISTFADYLRDFSKDTQFVVVTHRKGTMERCDGLYGVAMEEKGRFQDAQRRAEGRERRGDGIKAPQKDDERVLKHGILRIWQKKEKEQQSAQAAETRLEAQADETSGRKMRRPWRRRGAGRAG
ncbi:MAG: hypothetical protein ACLS7Z_02455 [Christensenellales bacterium]